MKLYCNTCEGIGRIYNVNVECKDCGGNGYTESTPIDGLIAVKEHCLSVDDCNKCEIQKECGDIRCKHEVPARWRLDNED